MSARLMMLCVAILLVGCCTDEPADDDGASQSVQLVGGQAVCDSCFSVRLVLTGPGIVNVDEATFVTSDMARTSVAARIALSREPGASGEVLVVTAYFDGGISAGDFDLWLDPVTAGDAARVVPAALRVTRARPGPSDMATLRVWVQSTGTDRDGRFVVHTVAGCQSDACEPFDVEAYRSKSLLLPPGAYTFRLDGVASNCTTTAGSNPVTLTLERGTVTALSYTLSCTQLAEPGWVRVANVTTGPALDDEYLVSCSPFACLPFKLAANRDTVLRLVPGDLTVRIGEVAPNCSVSGPLEVSATAAVGDTADVSFAIACTALPRIRVTVRTTGREIDPEFEVSACSFQSGCSFRPTSANDVIVFEGLASGEYDIGLGGLAENCLVTSGFRHVQVLGGAGDVDVTLDVTCSGYGIVRITATTTGANQDQDYVVSRLCDDNSYYYCETAVLLASGSVDFRTVPGPKLFELWGVEANCSVTGPAWPALVTAIEDAVVELRLEVVCR
ncbi:MAG: hypothetical protein ACJ8B6_13675 [Gemmatimonadales bacterium]